MVTQYQYDANGDRTSTTQNYKAGVTPDNQTNVTTSATYDAIGEAVTSTDASNVVTQTTYDARGNATQVVKNYVANGPKDDHTNVTTTTTYDALGRPVQATDAKGTITQTDYDLDGRAVDTIANYVSGGRRTARPI